MKTEIIIALIVLALGAWVGSTIHAYDLRDSYAREIADKWMLDALSCPYLDKSEKAKTIYCQIWRNNNKRYQWANIRIVNK